MLDIGDTVVHDDGTVGVVIDYDIGAVLILWEDYDAPEWWDMEDLYA